MIKKLRKRLAILLILAITLALVVASGAALMVSENQLSLREQAAFSSILSALSQDVRMERSLSSAKLAKTEASEGLLIRVYDGGQPIPFRGGWRSPTDREALFAQALDLAAGQGVTPDSPKNEPWMGQLRGDGGERYLAAVQPLNSYRDQRAVVLLQSMAAKDAQRVAQRYRFAAIAFGAMAVMALFGWLFTSRVMRPIAQAHAQQNAFVAAASHELRTPLQVMQSNLDALSQAPPDPHPFIATMQGEVDRMSRLSGDLMHLTQVGAPDRFGPVEIYAIAQDAAREHGSLAKAKGVALSVAPAGALPLVNGDEAMLRRAVNILVDNAICYTPPGGHVVLSVKATRQAVLLAVEDDGPGIAPQYVAHIFEPFYRADPSRSDRAHSGLGLSIARKIALTHLGQLAYEPASPQGSRFTLQLPRA